MDRNTLKRFIPPALLPGLSRLVYGPPPIRYAGRFESWDQAEARSTGYSSDEILHKVRAAARKVATGEAVYERDSVLFDAIEYRFPVMAALARIACINGGCLSLIDFGGGLGNSYRQFRSFFPECKPLRWSIIEQPNYVECGQAEFQDDALVFYHSVADCLKSEQASVALFSSVLQYLETPYSVLDQIIANRIEYLLIDLTPVSQRSEDFLTIQIVRPPIYTADYPCWIFSESRMIHYLKSNYELLLQFDCMEMSALHKFDAAYRGFFCRLRD
jgi:putative methyltransferase (TIGR04325 family)